MARKQQSDSLPEIFEGGVQVTPERWAFLQSLKNRETVETEDGLINVETGQESEENEEEQPA